MDYFSKFLRTTPRPAQKQPHDLASEFHQSWMIIRDTLMHPDERQLLRGINSTNVPAHLQSMVDALVLESSRTEEGGTGACLEYLLKNDVLGTLVKLSELDRPSGIQAEVLRAVQNMVVLLDEQFLVHSVIHKAVLRLLRNCVGDDVQEQLDNKLRARGAAGNIARSQPSDYELDLVNLLCILCSRIRTHRELLMIFFHDKHWYHSEPLFSVEEEDEDDDNGDDENEDKDQDQEKTRNPSPTPSQTTVTSAPTALTRKTEYEFLLFNYLLRFVHREGEIGEFARAGLLFLMDVAMTSEDTTHRPTSEERSSQTQAPLDPVNEAAVALAEYIIDGDFSDVLGAGLGAVYSLLPSKLQIRPVARSGDNSSNMVLGKEHAEADEDEEEMRLVEQDRNRALGVEDSSNMDFRGRLDHFLKLLEFLQDVLKRNKSPNLRNKSADAESNADIPPRLGDAIVQSIIDAVRRIFLENILYPSILECSDHDGSAVAVMSYIEIMIRTLRNEQLSRSLIDFLMSEDNDDISRSAAPAHQSRSRAILGPGSMPPQSSSGGSDKEKKSRRRKSSAMALLEMEAPNSRKPSEYFTSSGRFTLKDLLVSNLRSRDTSTSNSALSLFQTVLTVHCRLSIDRRLLLVIPDSEATTFPEPTITFEHLSMALKEVENEEEEDAFDRDDNALGFAITPLFKTPEITYSTHEREVGLYLALISRVDPSHAEDAFSTGYENYLQDSLFAIQSQLCYQIDEDPHTRAHAKHRLNVNDSIISSLLDSLRKFFANTPEQNLTLTGVLSILAQCPDRSLAGWLTFANSDSHRFFGDDDHILKTQFNMGADGDDKSIDFDIEETLFNDERSLPASSIGEHSRPIIHSIFHALVSQLEQYRQMVENFDQYLLERRQGLLFNERLTDALTLALDISSDSLGGAQSNNETLAPRPPSPPQAQRPKPFSAASSFMAMLTPKKSKPSHKSTASTTETDAASNVDGSGDKTTVASSFSMHYRKTGAIKIEPLVPPVPTTGPWVPTHTKTLPATEDDMFSSGTWGGETSDSAEQSMQEHEEEVRSVVTLSRLLDNVVILEESIKELVAIIQARRSLGIDAIRYL